jgi:hypothetical protein
MAAVLAGLVRETGQSEPGGGIGKPQPRLGVAPPSAVVGRGGRP